MKLTVEKLVHAPVAEVWLAYTTPDDSSSSTRSATASDGSSSCPRVTA